MTNRLDLSVVAWGSSLAGCRPHRWGLLSVLTMMFAFMAVSTVTNPAAAQFENMFGGQDPFAVPKEDPVRISASFQPVAETQQAVLSVTANIGDGYHIYSATQKGGLPSTFKLSDKSIQVLSEFIPDVEPVLHPPKEFDYATEEHEGKVTWQAVIEFPEGVEASKQKIEVKYSGLACDKVGCKPFHTTVNAKASNGIAKVPEVLVASMQGLADNATGDAQEETAPPTLPVGEESIVAGNATIKGWTDKAAYAPGEKASIIFNVDLQDSYHTYPYVSPEKRVADFAPTLIGVLEVAGTSIPVSEFKIQPPKANKEPHVGVLGLEEFTENVQWQVDFTIPDNAKAGQLAVHGVMQSQTCNESSCDIPAQMRWHVSLKVAENAEAGKVNLIWGEANKPAKTLLTDPDKASAFLDALLGRAGEDVAVLPPSYEGVDSFDVSVLKPQPFQETSNISLPMILGIALLGGFILNFMPCVLPVIGLKILSLVEQAGESRSKALAFNLVYVMGMLSVFWVLAILISTKEFGWGSQFSSTLFNVTFAAVVFAMALSYLEVWEITLPSFVGAQSSKLEQKDGWIGTFFKGAVTTILATPCSGPGLATALAWCADKPAWIILIVFTFLGLGMGLPYLLVALFPPIIAFLPKPGPWMNTFKQLMGFVLLGTVAFFMSYVDMEYLFPTICFLMVVWFACWMVGRLTFSSKPTTWVGTWAMSLLVVVGSSYFIFGWQVSNEMNKWLGGDFNQRFASDWNLISAQEYRLNSFVDRQISDRRLEPADPETDKHKIKWVPFSLQALEHYTQGENPQTVFIDFTADWCANCKVFERLVLHSEGIERRLASEDVVAMIADKTMDNEEIDALLDSLGAGNQIPLYAVFPKEDPTRPLTMDGTSISIANVNSVLDQVGVRSAATIAAAEEAEGNSAEVAEAESQTPADDEDGLPMPTETAGHVSASSQSAM